MDNNSTHRIIINGQTVESVSQTEARANMARIFKLGDKQLDLIFQGKPLVFKKGLTPEQVEKFAAALKKCGLNHKVDPPLPSVDEAPEDELPLPDNDLINANAEAAAQEAAADQAVEQASPAPEQAHPDTSASADQAGNETDFEATMIMDSAPGRKAEAQAQPPAADVESSEDSEPDFEATMIMDSAPGRAAKPKPDSTQPSSPPAGPSGNEQSESATDKAGPADDKPAAGKNKMVIGIAAAVIVIGIAIAAVLLT